MNKKDASKKQSVSPETQPDVSRRNFLAKAAVGAGAACAGLRRAGCARDRRHRLDRRVPIEASIAIEVDVEGIDVGIRITIQRRQIVGDHPTQIAFGGVGGFEDEGFVARRVEDSRAWAIGRDAGP